jgi:energy-coupling factor transporter ATP-binding protein EcfA2
MENRLEFFRRQMAAFDGAADPRGEIERGLYIEEPEHSATGQLFKRICLKPNSRNLLVGGIGSGKTTQLLRLEQLLQDTDIYPCYIDVTTYDNSDNIQESLLDVIVGLELIDLLGQAKIDLDKQLISRITECAYGRLEEVDILTGFSFQQSKFINDVVAGRKRKVLRGGTIPTPAENRKDTIRQDISALIEEFQKSFLKTPFFLFDGLDRMNNIEKFIRTASSGLRDVPSGFIIVAPISLLYSEFAKSIDVIFNHFEYRSTFDIENAPESYNFFAQILSSRATKDFLSEPALKKLIYMSGGILRDLINLTQEAIQEAYLSDAEQLEERHVDSAVRSFGRAKILGVSDDESEILGKLMNDDKQQLFIPTSSEGIMLLANAKILEYRYPKRRFVVHPVLQPLLSIQVATLS